MANKTDKTKVVIYVRLSKKAEAKYGYSAETQIRDLIKFAQENDLEIVKTYIELGVDTDPNRSSFNEMISFLRNSKDCKTILVSPYSKMFRKANKTLKKLKDISIETVFHDQDDISEDILCMLNILKYKINE